MDEELLLLNKPPPKDGPLDAPNAGLDAPNAGVDDPENIDAEDCPPNKPLPNPGEVVRFGVAVEALKAELEPNARPVPLKTDPPKADEDAPNPLELNAGLLAPKGLPAIPKAGEELVPKVVADICDPNGDVLDP